MIVMVVYCGGSVMVMIVVVVVVAVETLVEGDNDFFFLYSSV